MTVLVNSNIPNFLNNLELNKPCNLKESLYQIEYLNNNKKYIEKRRKQSFELIKLYLIVEGIWDYLPKYHIKIKKNKKNNLKYIGAVDCNGEWDDINNRFEFFWIDMYLPLNFPGDLIQYIIIHETSHIIQMFYNKEDNELHDEEFHNICNRLFPNYTEIKIYDNKLFMTILNYKKITYF